MPPMSSVSAQTKAIDAEPDAYRMTVGEHLEELRRRIVLGLIGVAVALIACLVFGDQVLLWFCKPLYQVLEAKQLNAQLVYQELGEGFMAWFQVCCVTATALSSPWLVYQIWLFIAAGLYPNERHYVTKFAPLSILLLVTGMAFVYFAVLPWSIEFFISFANDVPVPQTRTLTSETYTPFKIPILQGDPANPQVGELWFDKAAGRLNVRLDQDIRSIPFRSGNLLTPEIKLQEYIDLVISMLVLFGLSFQMPLIVLALVKIGILQVETLKKFRRHVYFVMAILAATITPGSDITSMLALTVPLCLLFELGLWLSRNTGQEPQIDTE